MTTQTFWELEALWVTPRVPDPETDDWLWSDEGGPPAAVPAPIPAPEAPAPGPAIDLDQFRGKNAVWTHRAAFRTILREKYKRLCEAMTREARASSLRKSQAETLYAGIPDAYINWWAKEGSNVCRVRGCLSFGKGYLQRQNLRQHCQTKEHRVRLNSYLS
ncbi:hypothetical protein VTJ49DRAFT_4216 [Mycothermus thermophilus]|uniref:C2H2-type domain-containing protein n=1 Tax=Humicola insolens TaxID=85995 RepID=A0ABR3V5U1_HUMIN